MQAGYETHVHITSLQRFVCVCVFYSAMNAFTCARACVCARVCETAGMFQSPGSVTLHNHYNPTEKSALIKRGTPPWFWLTLTLSLLSLLVFFSLVSFMPNVVLLISSSSLCPLILHFFLSLSLSNFHVVSVHVRVWVAVLSSQSGRRQ